MIGHVLPWIKVAPFAIPVLFCAQAMSQDGSLDPSFDPGLGINVPGDIATIIVQPDGKILIAGDFSSYNGTTRNKIARLNPDGSLDETFDPGSGPNYRINDMALLPDGRIVVAGPFSEFAGVEKWGVARLNSDGTLDQNFHVDFTTSWNSLGALLLQPDGRIVIAGYFTQIEGVDRYRLARVEMDGSLDMTFDPGAGVAGSSHLVLDMQLHPDGRILLVGHFNTYDLISRQNVASVNPDGALDLSFTPAPGTDNWTYSAHIQDDGNILLGGSFSLYNNAIAPFLVRVDPAGTTDDGFSPLYGPTDLVLDIVQQADGKFLIAGDFTQYDAVPRHRIARLNMNGTLDASFDPGNGADDWIQCIAIQPDGRVLLGGQFTSYDGVARAGIVRVNAASEVGISENERPSGIMLYPNPVQDILTVDLNASIHAGHAIDLTITDVSGKQVGVNSGITTSTFQFDTTELSSGMYTVICNSLQGMTMDRFTIP